MSNVIVSIQSFSVDRDQVDIYLFWLKEDGGAGDTTIRTPLTTFGGTIAQINSDIKSLIQTYMGSIGFPLTGSDKVILFNGAV